MRHIPLWVALATTVSALPLAGQSADARSSTDDPARPVLSFWDAGYWEEWEAERAAWRAEWRDYARLHPSGVPAEMHEIIHEGTPTPHRLDGGSTALAELQYGVAPGTWTRELRRSGLFMGRRGWRDGVDLDLGPRERLELDRIEAEIRRSIGERRTQLRLERARSFYREILQRLVPSPPPDMERDRRERDRERPRRRRPRRSGN